MQVIKHFRNNHIPKTWYDAKDGSALIVPQEARWI